MGIKLFEINLAKISKSVDSVIFLANNRDKNKCYQEKYGTYCLDVNIKSMY